LIITFLGTGTSQGVPVIGCTCKVCNSIDFRDKRTRTSIHLYTKGVSLVVDTGPDFRQQVLRERIIHLDGVLFTHEHRDHTAGLDDLRSFNFLQKEDIPIYGRKKVINQLKKEFAYVFEEHKYPGIPQVDANVIDNKEFRLKGLNILPIEVLHHKLPVFGFRIGDFTYITDANDISSEEKDKIRGSEIIVVNALQQEKHISHFNLPEAIDLIDELGPEKAYFTHISHKLGSHDQVERSLGDNMFLAYDGLKIEI
jgi:phosphoribosyl 1,2-cyclic phosphate phosphodiesterase